MKTWLVDLGNSNDGPIGMCARIQGETAEDAVRRLQEIMTTDPCQACFDVTKQYDRLHDGQDGEYIHIFVNTANVTAADACDPEDFEEEGASTT